MVLSLSLAFWLPVTCLSNVVDQAHASSQTELVPQEINGSYFALLLGLVFAFTCLRQSVETFIYRPVGVYFGLRGHEKRLRLEKNEVLEQAYKHRRAVHKDANQLQILAFKTQLTERQVQRWLRVRRALDKPSTLVKFTESGWRLTFYTTMVIYGFYHLSGKPYFQDITECWKNFPNDAIDKDTLWYYTIEQSYYLSCILSIFSDVRRKDFVEMLVHHCVTFFLLFASLYCSAVRIGSLIILLHDVADIFLESSKMFHYIKFRWICDTCFCIFMIVWVFTRLYLFPFKVIRSVIFESLDLPALYPGIYYSCSIALLTLQCLHLIWTYYIYRVFYQNIFKGKGDDDPRSGSSGSDTESSGTETQEANGPKSQKHD